MKIHPLKSDNRYTIRREFFRGKSRLVLRFNDVYVGESKFYETLALRAVGHRAIARGALTFTNQPA